MSDLEAVIESAVADATDVTPDPVTDASDAIEADASPVPHDASPAEADASEPSEPVVETAEVASPATKVVDPAVQDEFEKKFGIPAVGSGGRENRIPYSRVKKITEKAVADARKELEPKVAQYETKLKDYEERLGRVDNFEKIMTGEPQRFLQMLSTIPAYKQFFDFVQKAVETHGQAQATSAQPPVPVVDDMPQPDQKLPDGTMAYSLDGIKALNAWNRAQARKEVMNEVEQRYKPIEEEWQVQKRIQAVIPQIQAQINDARTWPSFKENEDEIVKVLASDRSISLESAYRKVVFPKLEAERNSEKERLAADRTKMREELLAELKQAPRATSAGSVGSQSSVQGGKSGPKKLEDIIAEQIKSLK
jgi:hypothetical protein